MKNSVFIMLGLSLFLLAKKGGAMTYENSTKRGIQNNNPGNIIKTNIDWKGKVPLDNNTDSEYEQFTNPQDGIRALFINLRTMIGTRGLNTIGKLIPAYSPKAPSIDNYIKFVSRRLNKAPNVKLISADIPAIGRAIIQFENGEQPYSYALLTDAYKDSFIDY